MIFHTAKLYLGQVCCRQLKLRKASLGILIILLLSFCQNYENLHLITYLYGDTKKTVTEYDSKAAYLYYFLKYTKWSNQENFENYQIGILGEDPFGEKLNILIDKTVNDKKILIHRIKSLDQVSQYQVLFICESERDRLQNIISVLKNRPILTVSDIDGFGDANGMVTFIRHENKVRFKINNSKIKKSGLSVSSYLLRMSR